MLRALSIVKSATGPFLDVVTLSYDDRHRRRMMLTGQGGHDFLLDLGEVPDLRDGDGITIADDAAAFARAVALLHDSEAQWRTQASRAVERCEALYAPEAALAVYRGMLGAERSQEVA